jgi:hypothetical protein
VFDVSDADFAIRGELNFLTPAGGERWITNEVHNLTWTTRGTIANVKLEYSKDNFATSTVITNSVAISIVTPGPFQTTGRAASRCECRMSPT